MKNVWFEFEIVVGVPLPLDTSLLLPSTFAFWMSISDAVASVDVTVLL